MKKGDVLNGYVLTTDPQNGGGHSEWAFAKKDGDEYFLKRFLQPTYPLPDGPGSEKTKMVKRQRCEEFERHQRLVMRQLRPISGDGGNLVITKEFFRERAFYYKVTDKVSVSRTSVRDIAALDRESRILIMLTAAKSLDTLHKAGLVHGDVKPDNLLIKALDKGRFAIKVIDFDNCFPVHRPPAADQLVGDPVFYSPELLLYNTGGAPGDQLDEKNDVFALGLVFWQYLTGERPGLPTGITYPAEAVSKGTALTLPKSVKDRPLADLVHSMLARGSGDRPSMSEVHNALKMARRLGPAAVPAAPVEPAIPAEATRGVLGGRLSRARAMPEADTSVLSDKADKKGMRGSLWSRLRSGAAAPVPGFVSGPDDVPVAGPSADEPAPALKGSLTGPRPVILSAEEKDEKDKTTKGELRGSLLKKKE
jgi:eukaryotic-like serine/threonine-protein kinase